MIEDFITNLGKIIFIVSWFYLIFLVKKIKDSLEGGNKK